MRKKSKAFTLIEMLLGLSIFSIIALSIYGTFSSGIELARRSENINKVYREIRLSLEKMARDLENMVSYDFANSYPEKLSFSGATDKISFLISTETGLKTVDYYLKPLEYDSIYKTIVGKHTSLGESIVVRYEETRSFFALVREEKSFIDSLQATVNQETETETEVLSPNIVEEGLKFSYAYLEGEGEETKIIWKDSWEKKHPPSGVRVVITFIKRGKKEDMITVQRDVYIPIGYLGEEKL